MRTHSVAEAKNQLSQLIDRALKGERVVITRHGRPVVELTPTGTQPAPVSLEGLDWLAERRGRRRPMKEDAGAFVSKMRDEEWER